MNKYKGSEPQNQNLSPQKNKPFWSAQEREILTAFFTVLAEIEQQINVTKEYQNENQDK